jgi:hypothetical protein
LKIIINILYKEHETQEEEHRLKELRTGFWGEYLGPRGLK